jgi:hypothetical protein
MTASQSVLIHKIVTYKYTDCGLLVRRVARRQTPRSSFSCLQRGLKGGCALNCATASPVPRSWITCTTPADTPTYLCLSLGAYCLQAPDAGVDLQVQRFDLP